jgi:hypothetical protein
MRLHRKRSVRCPDGSPQCQVLWTQVNAQRVPMPAPFGGSFSLAWTVQPAGVHFDPPAQVCIPNTDAPAGWQGEMFGFDHDLGEFIALGPATVTLDGSQLCSDPGYGIGKAGWGGGGPRVPPCAFVCYFQECKIFATLGCSCTPTGDIRVVSVEPTVNDETSIEVPLGTEVQFRANAETENCIFVQYFWNFDEGDPGAVNSIQANPTHTYTKPGDYTAVVIARCLGCGEKSGAVRVKVLDPKVNMTAYRPQMVSNSVPLNNLPRTQLEIPDDEEENPGAGIRLNGDDDDGAGGADANQSVVALENDLIEVELRVAPRQLPPGCRFVLKRSNPKINVWESDGKGTPILKDEDEKVITFEQDEKTVWVENVEKGEAMLELQVKRNDEDPVVSERIKFFTFTSLIVGLSGETFGEVSPLGNGMFPVSQRLYLNGYNVAYYETTPSRLDLVTGNPAFREMAMQIKDSDIRQVALFGHSHGGGAVYNLSNLLNDRQASLGPFTLVFTGYVDAIKYDGIATSASELRLPPGTSFHWNYFQPQDSIFELLYGGSVEGAAVNRNVNDPLLSAAPLDHVTIDNDPVVQSQLGDAITSHIMEQ